MGFEITQVKSVTGNAYLMVGSRIALVDTLMPFSHRKLIKSLNSKGLSAGDVEFILITHHHADHVGNAARIKELSGAVVIAGAQDAPVIEGTRETPPPSDLNRIGRMMGRLPSSWVKGYQSYPEVKVDRTVTGGEVIEELGLEVLPLPGHTEGGVGFLDREGGRAFVGDIVSNWFGRPGMPSICASHSFEKIFESQEMLAGLGLDIAYPGHGPVIEPEASEKIARMLTRKRAKYQGAP